MLFQEGSFLQSPKDPQNQNLSYQLPKTSPNKKPVVLKILMYFRAKILPTQCSDLAKQVEDFYIIVDATVSKTTLWDNTIHFES